MALAAAAPAPAATPGQNGKLVFTSGRDGNYDVYSMNADGSNAVNLTQNPAADMLPAVAPGGGKIAFTSFRDGGDGEIYVMNADGSGATNLTQTAGVDSEPTWSPDGQRIAFRSDRSGDWDVYVMNADGSDVANLTRSAGVDDAPAWSPGGDRIAFETDRDGNSEIYTMNADGTGQANVTAHPGQDHQPSWAPDGQRIAFGSDRDGNFEIYTMTQGGALQTRLTNDAAGDTEPAWSPDAAKIAFRSTRDGNSEVYVMSAGGAAPTRLTNVSQFDGHPDWQSLAGGFPRPKGASPLRVALVPAYQACLSPTHEHGPPLAYPSCSPPAQRSPRLTVGTADANGAPVNSTGFLRFAVRPGAPGAPDDSDARIAFSLTDVRCRFAIAPCAGGVLTDYTGELKVIMQLRVTDRDNGVAAGGGTDAATVTDMGLAVTVQCATTATAEGALCDANTSANAITPGFARDGKRMLIEMSKVQVEDGGADGLADTEPNAVFVTQGIFVP